MNNKLFSKSEKANDNYLSRVIKIDNLHHHPKADRLDITVVDGGNVIVARESVKIGDIMIFCAVESALNTGFLSNNNQFEDKELNINKEVKGFFNKKGRVKALNLREIPSRGFCFPPEWLRMWQPDIEENNWEEYAGIEFDTVNGLRFSKKYVIEKKQSNPVGQKKNKRNTKLKRFDKLIENQFNFHYDTSFLVKKLDRINPDDVISITEKIHGTSVICSNIIINKKLKWHEKLLKKLGVNITTTEYGPIISSRGVIKNRYINENVGEGYYKVDVWTEASKKIIPLLAKGETIYAEIVGYLPDSTTFIQKMHDYKCNEGEFEVYVYRITQTNVDGIVYELSATQVQQWCELRGLKAVREMYYGKAKDLYPDIEVDDNWHQNFFDRLKNDKEKFYMECSSPNCYNDVPHEGLVIRNDSNNDMPALKLKTELHYQWDSKQLDKGEVDIESDESLN